MKGLLGLSWVIFFLAMWDETLNKRLFKGSYFCIPQSTMHLLLIFKSQKQTPHTREKCSMTLHKYVVVPKIHSNRHTCDIYQFNISIPGYTKKNKKSPQSQEECMFCCFKIGWNLNCWPVWIGCRTQWRRKANMAHHITVFQVEYRMCNFRENIWSKKL